ncbi:unnamed protein product [Linum tenue]|uniref:Uncharacterized protein n=1 Tax=Linum tenue TaxID=586396 RepID=A0AAV0KFK4_9ROSI|nr:unnamed protein product [Linum tenue]
MAIESQSTTQSDGQNRNLSTDVAAVTTSSGGAAATASGNARTSSSAPRSSGGPPSGSKQPATGVEPTLEPVAGTSAGRRGASSTVGDNLGDFSYSEAESELPIAMPFVSLSSNSESGERLLSEPTPARNSSKRSLDITSSKDLASTAGEPRLKGLLVEKPATPLDSYIAPKRQKRTSIDTSVSFSSQASLYPVAAKRVMHVIAEGLAVPDDYTQVAGTPVLASDTKHLAAATSRFFFEMMLHNECLQNDLLDANTKVLKLEDQIKEGREGVRAEVRDEVLKEQAQLVKDNDAQIESGKESATC